MKNSNINEMIKIHEKFLKKKENVHKLDAKLSIFFLSTKLQQFQGLTVFHQVSEYFRSYLRISHEFCIFDLNQSVLLFIPSYYFIGNARLQRHASVKYGIYFLRFSNVIDISRDRF